MIPSEGESKKGYLESSITASPATAMFFKYLSGWRPIKIGVTALIAGSCCQRPNESDGRSVQVSSPA